MAEPTITELMRQAGIVQEGDPRLSRVARRFELPADQEEALSVIDALDAAADRVSAVHEFAKGVGVAAPQIGIERAAAIVRLPGGRSMILLNPVVVEKSEETDEQFEGCLSFFDVRGRVPRPLMMRVAHDWLDGSQQVSRFEHGAARLVAHEIDHLAGKLFKEKMRPGMVPIPLAEYRGTGSVWQYSK
ncbi:peptide deformylase [Nocardia sp. NBC_01730]|uniref:peptide deformylase n=1 Tax=Nocardia sp. NBC_01730 TaxID=2975998 RepID=UPI002E0F603B|nr:peptide deformylase [Nocardia sp. NBC_01730]